MFGVTPQSGLKTFEYKDSTVLSIIKNLGLNDLYKLTNLNEMIQYNCLDKNLNIINKWAHGI